MGPFSFHKISTHVTVSTPIRHWSSLDEWVLTRFGKMETNLCLHTLAEILRIGEAKKAPTMQNQEIAMLWLAFYVLALGVAISSPLSALGGRDRQDSLRWPRSHEPAWGR